MLKLKIPPVVIFFICLGLIWIINQLQLVEGLRFGAGQSIIWAIVVIGGLIGFLSLYEFKKSSTTVNPHKPENTSTLVTSGVYQFSRNPMYLALLIMLGAAIFKWGSVFGVLVIPLFVWFMNHYQIKPEEKVLEEKFGEEFQQYKEHVRRWA